MRHLILKLRSFSNEIFAGTGNLTENLLVANIHSSPKKGGRMRSPPLVWLFCNESGWPIGTGNLSLFLQANAAQSSPSGADFFVNLKG